MPKFTPGTWHTENEPGDWGLSGAVRVFGDGKEICSIEYTTPYCAGASRSDIENYGRAQCDAHLIAAAPDLYEAVIRSIIALEALYPSGTRLELEYEDEQRAVASLLDYCRAAIDKVNL